MPSQAACAVEGRAATLWVGEGWAQLLVDTQTLLKKSLPLGGSAGMNFPETVTTSGSWEAVGERVATREKKGVSEGKPPTQREARGRGTGLVASTSCSGGWGCLQGCGHPEGGQA